MSFKLYTNQEIYDLLNKKTASVRPDPSMPAVNPSWWDQAGDFFSSNYEGALNPFREMWGFKQKARQNWSDIVGNVQDITRLGIQPEAVQAYRAAILHLFDAMEELNRDGYNPEKEQQYYNALKNVYTSIDPEQLKGNPALAKYFADTFSKIWENGKEYFSHIDPRIRNRQIEFEDPNTGKTVSINANSITTKAMGIATAQATKTLPISSIEHSINTKVVNGELTPEQGQELIKEEKFKRLNGSINKLLSGFEYKNPQQREQSLQEAERLMQEAASSSDSSFSDDDFASTRDKMSALATRFNVKSFTDKAFARQFGDLSTNPLYKNNHNALYKAFDEYAKLNPGMNLDEFIKEKVYGKNVDPSQIYAQQIADAKQLKGRGYYMGYDPETGEILYGSGANYTPMGKSSYKGFKRITADQAVYNSLINNANLNNYQQRLRTMRELGFDEKAARDIALRGAIKIHTTSRIDGRGSKEGYAPTIIDVNDRVGSDQSIKDLNDHFAPKQNTLDLKSPLAETRKPLPNQVTFR